MAYRRDRCRRCKRSCVKAGPISVRGLCVDCGMERMAEAADAARKTKYDQAVAWGHVQASAIQRDNGG